MIADHSVLEHPGPNKGPNKKQSKDNYTFLIEAVAKCYTEQCHTKVIESLRNLLANSKKDFWFYNHSNASAQHVNSCLLPAILHCSVK